MEQNSRRILVRTFTGHAFDILNTKPSDFNIKDIAHHLSLQNRFIGATQHGYSTAQHSVYVMQMIDRLWGPKPVPTVVLLQALLHDSEEAYTGDFITPIKRDRIAGGALQEIGNHLRGDILEAFHLPRIMVGQIKTADNLVCAAEVRDLMHMAPSNWGVAGPDHHEQDRAMGGNLRGADIRRRVPAPDERARTRARGIGGGGMSAQELIKAAEKLMQFPEFEIWWEATYSRVIPPEDEPIIREMAKNTWETSRVVAMGTSVQDIIAQLKEKGAI